MTLEYDAIGDFPAYANPLSLANAAAGLVYVHGDQGPDNVDLATADTVSKTVTKPGEGTDTYILVRAEHLPLLQPVRDVSTALGTTALTEPVLGAVEPTLRLGVDMGYTDRTYQNADKPTRFSLVTPPSRVVQTAAALPGAVAEGRENLRNGAAALGKTSHTARTDGNKATPTTRAGTQRGKAVRAAINKVLRAKPAPSSSTNDDASTSDDSD
nr:PE-PPE domain-containing protein [Mycobacterium sp. QGD 101]